MPIRPLGFGKGSIAKRFAAPVEVMGRAIRIEVDAEDFDDQDAPPPVVPRPVPKRQGVYFVALLGFLKIGVSADICYRWLAPTDVPIDVERLGYIPCADYPEMRRLEKELHEQFRSLRHRGEWFRRSALLLAFIDAHAQPWPEP